MRGVFSVAAGCLIVVSTGLPARADETRPDTLKARDVLERVARVYAGCKTYRDTGVVTTVFVEATGSWVLEKPFTTAFVRPDRFRFQYAETRCGLDHRFIVWRRGDEIRAWWTVKPRFEKRDSLEMALAAATGVSGGSAHTVPALLLPNEIGGRRLTDITEATRAEDATIDTVNFFRIRGTFGDLPMTLWIDKNTFLVRRIDSKKTIGNFSTEETTTYDPVIDGEVPDAFLEFDPTMAK